ncbi:hypothetical protein [Micromonospora sp. NPDC005806]|uniref:hypothetical protein n=1 Tax=Micromonospora sp. NPDC005806 TaxID=3364234 RepID=UPI0036AF4CD8
MDEPPADGSAAPVPLSGAGDLGAAEQVSWLARVARAMDNPTVRAVVAADAPALR